MGVGSGGSVRDRVWVWGVGAECEWPCVGVGSGAECERSRVGMGVGRCVRSHVWVWGVGCGMSLVGVEGSDGMGHDVDGYVGRIMEVGRGVQVGGGWLMVDLEYGV